MPPGGGTKFPESLKGFKAVAIPTLPWSSQILVDVLRSTSCGGAIAMPPGHHKQPSQPFGTRPLCRLMPACLSWRGHDTQENYLLHAPGRRNINHEIVSSRNINQEADGVAGKFHSHQCLSLVNELALNGLLGSLDR